MNNSGRRALDIALATAARGMYSGLLTAEEKERIAQAGSTQELLSVLQRNEAWHDAALMLQSGDLTDTRFSEAVSRCVYADFEKLYRFANDESREFLNFITLDEELQAVLKALRRLASPPAEEEGTDVLPPLFRNLPGHCLEKLRRAASWEELCAAVRGTIFEKPLLSLERDEKTGLPALSQAVTALEASYFSSLADYMQTGYSGPDARELTNAVVFRADMLNIAYLMRLRRFGAAAESRGRLLLPLHGSITAKIERQVLEAGSDEEALALLRGTKSGRYLPKDFDGSAEALARAAQSAYFRRVLHGRPGLQVVYAFLTLREFEADMLRRVFVALKYGLSPAPYMA